MAHTRRPDGTKSATLRAVELVAHAVARPPLDRGHVVDELDARLRRVVVARPRPRARLDDADATMRHRPPSGTTGGGDLCR